MNPSGEKKDDSLIIETNFDGQEKTNSKSKNPEDVLAQLQANNTKVSKKAQKTKKIPARQLQRLENLRKELLQSINSGSDERYDTPQTFQYRSMNPEGRLETGTFIGVSKLDIYTFLTGEGYTIYSLQTSKLINFVYGQAGGKYSRMSVKDLIFFISQLETYIKSGITLTEAMRILSKQLKKNKKQHAITQSIVYYLTMGEAFSSALEKQVGAFPPLVINMVKAAEAAGNLDETLEDLSHYYEEINATQKQMISAMTYPVVVGIFSLIIIAFIMISIVPQFVGIYASAGAELNPLTIFVINSSNFLQKYIWYIVAGIFGTIGLLVLVYKGSKVFKKQMQTLMMHIPILGQIIIYNELTIFTKTFASLLRNDVFITDSIEILSKITNNEVYREIMFDTMNNITRGEKISESFKDHWAVPDIAYYMLVTGENTGQLPAMMSKVSSYYQEQHRAIVNSLKALIEPILIIFLAVVVGGVLIAVVYPMFELYGNIM